LDKLKIFIQKKYLDDKKQYLIETGSGGAERQNYLWNSPPKKSDLKKIKLFFIIL